jgi:hypothetical protein
VTAGGVKGGGICAVRIFDKLGVCGAGTGTGNNMAVVEYAGVIDDDVVDDRAGRGLETVNWRAPQVWASSLVMW